MIIRPFIIVCSFFLLCNLNGQIIRDYNIYQYTIDNGLSQNNLSRIHQDKLGYLWVSSQSGVDRLDGYTIFNYNPKNIYDTNSIKEFGNAISEDSNGNVWVGGRNGTLSVNNRKLSNWKSYTIVNDNVPGLSIYKTKRAQSLKFEVTGIVFENNSNNIYVGTRGMGLISLNLNTNIKSNHWFGDTSLTYQLMNEIHDVKKINNTLLLATSNGIIFWDLKDKRIIKHIIGDINNNKKVKFNNIIIQNSNEAFGAAENGLYTIDLKNHNVKLYNKESNLGLPENNITSIAFDASNKKLWLSVKTKGIYTFDLTSRNKFSKFNVSPYYDSTFKEGIINSILIDKQKNIWLNSYGNGLYKLSPKNKYFKLYSKNIKADIKINTTICKSVYIDKKNKLWIGSYDPGGGIIEIDRETGKTKNYLFNYFLQEQKVWNFFEDQKGNLWVFAKSNDEKNEGLIFFKKRLNSNAFEKVGATELLKKVNNLPFVNIPSTTFSYLTKKGELILNASQIIQVVDRDGNLVFKPYNGLDNLKKIDKSAIAIIKRETNNKTYILTEQGLYNWEEENGKITKLNHKIEINEISRLSNYYMSILKDSIAFIPTYGYGILKINFKNQTKSFITKENSEIASQFLYDSYFDNNKYLWMSSNKGIIRYNIYDNSVHNFTKEEGIQEYEFNSKSQFVSQSGEVAIAGVNGVNTFFAFENKQKEIPNLIIQRILFKDNSKKLVHSSTSDDVIVIPYNENKFSIDFISLNFRSDENIKYEYQLKGYDRENTWFQPRNYNNREYQPSATYENLPPGKYTFKARSFLSDNSSIKNEATLMIEVKAAPWNTPWAYFLYIIILGAFTISGVKFYEKKKIKDLENKRKNDDLMAAKMLQNDMLPKSLPKRNDLNVAVALKTSTEVGGDYYDFFEQEDGSIFVVSGDATGHGIASGMMVSVTKAALNGIPSTTPELLLQNLNNVIRRVGIKNLKMSLSVAHLGPNCVSISSSAMPPIYYFSSQNNLLEEINFSSLPLGAIKNEKYTLVEREFLLGDILIFISDGIPEAMNKKQEALGYKFLYSFIRQNIHQTPENLKLALLKLADEWVGSDTHADDISIVIIKKVK